MGGGNLILLEKLGEPTQNMPQGNPALQVRGLGSLYTSSHPSLLSEFPLFCGTCYASGKVSYSREGRSSDRELNPGAAGSQANAHHVLRARARGQNN